MKRYALVVGIGNYANLNPLTRPANDARAVAEVLRSHGDFQDVTVLNGSKAKPGWVDHTSLTAELTKFLKQAAHQDALIYFTGHGFTVTESEFDQRGYLATSSSKVKVKEQQIIWQEDGLSFNTLNGMVQKAQLSSLLMLLDCCHSGFLIEDDLVKSSLLAFSRNNYCLIAACRSVQEAYALKSQEHSLFTGAFLESLLPANAEQGVVTALDAFGWIERKLRGSGQEPIFLGMGGAIPLVSYGTVTETSQDETCPYQGLAAFTEATAKFFFGRHRDVETLWQKLQQGNFVPVVGASGSGKSSLVRAGLIPALNQSGTNWVVLEPIKPGEEPLTQLRRPLEELTHQIADKVPLGTLIRRAPEGLRSLLEQLPASTKFLLVIDQFEEVFTICPDEAERTRFIDLITQTVTLPSSQLAVVLTIRADFIEPCLHYPVLKNLMQTQAVYLSPLAGQELTDAIAKPAERQGYPLTPHLLVEIVQDTQKEPGFLPLLQFALTQLWPLRDPQAHQLTVEAYESIGRLAGALNQHAEWIYTYRDYIDPDTGEINTNPIHQRAASEQAWIRTILLRLVRPSDGEKDTRHPQDRVALLALADSPQVLRPVLDSLIQGRLLVSERETIDLAHEALIQGWQRLARWCAESRDLRRLSQRLEAARREWEQDQQNSSLSPDDKNRNLMMGGLLAAVREQWQRLIPYLNDMARDEPFWQRSNAHEQDRITALQQALSESRLRELAARAQHWVSVQARTGLELALQAVGENLETFPEHLLSTVQGNLNQAMNVARIASQQWQGHTAPVRAIAISSDGTRVVSASADKAIRLWDRDGNPLGQPLVGHTASVWSVAISPDGTRIVSASSDKTIRLWDLDGNSIGQPLRGHTAAVLSVAFSSDGTRIASGSDDKTIRLWDFQGNPVGQPFQGHTASVRSLAFSPDGTRIVSASADKTIRIWNLEGNQVSQPLVGHTDSIRAVAVSPQGTHIISSSNDKTIRLWDVEGNSLGQPFQGHTDYVWSIAFSPDGTRIISSSDDKTIRLWDLQGNPLGQPLLGHLSYVRCVAVSPDGSAIISASDDTTIRVWDLHDNSLSPPRVGHTDSVWSVAFNPAGDRIVSASADKTIRLWDLQGNPLGQPFQGHRAYIRAVAISPDGTRIVSASDDTTLRVWDFEGNLISQPFVGHEFPVLAIAINSAGDRIVSASADKTIRIWDVEGNPLGQPLVGHTDAVRAVAIHPAGDRIVSGSADKTIRIWDFDGNPLGQPLVGHCSSIRSVAISPDGTYIVSGSDDTTLRLWDFDGNPLGQPFQAHRASIRAVAVSPDGTYIVSGSADKTIRLWDFDGNPIGQPFVGHQTYVRSVAVSPDGACIVSGSDDKTLRLWRGNWRSWLNVCCTRLAKHLLSQNPEIDLTTENPGELLRSEDPRITATQKACATCQKYAWMDAAGQRELATILAKHNRY